MTVEHVQHTLPGAPTGNDPGEVSDDLSQKVQNLPKVVAHFLDHRLLKGFGLGFRLPQLIFLLRPREAVNPEAATRVGLTDLKALFFVKEFDGNPAYREVAGAARPSVLGHQVSVRFRDGELLHGTSPSRDLRGPGFFMVPMDPRSNNRRIYVIAANAAKCRFQNEKEP
jgi:hypothetical protein